jgi:hypothetical protein
MTFPLERSSKADYYDSIYHASAVVGINSSAMIESSIVGRPVLSVLVDEFHDSQLATFHFSYLTESEGGPVRLAPSMAEHLDDLRAALTADAGQPAGARQFVADFVRPHGLERPATEIFVDALEELAEADVRPEPGPALLSAVRASARLAARSARSLATAGRGAQRLRRRATRVRV